MASRKPNPLSVYRFDIPPPQPSALGPSTRLTLTEAVEEKTPSFVRSAGMHLLGWKTSYVVTQGMSAA